MVIAWLIYPLLISALSLGLGLLVHGLSGGRLKPVLLLPVGYAALVVTSGFTTGLGETSRLTTPIVLVCAATGFVAYWHLRPRSIDPRLALAALGVFAVYAAPALLSGATTFAGFIKLDDGAQWLAMADRLIDGGRSAAGLPPSSHEATIAINFSGAYPVGVLPPLSVGGQVLRTDPIWLIQPYMAWLAGVLALSLAALLDTVVPDRRARAWTVFIAAQPALLLGYSLWGGIKEMAMAALVPVVAISVTQVPLERMGWGDRSRSLLPLAVVLGGGVLLTGVAGVWWFVFPLLWLAVSWVRAQGWRSAAVLVGLAGAMIAAMALPHLLLLDLSWIGGLATYAGGSLGDSLGNLWARLSPLQVVGIWPTGDFRGEPEQMLVTVLLIALVAACAGFGLWRSLHGGNWAVPLYVATTVPLAVIANLGSPWVGSKGLAIASPALLTAAGVGLAAVAARGWRLEASLGAGVVSVAVLWSSVLAYHDAWLAPHDSLADLEGIAKEPSLQAPALMLEYNVYATRHLFRELDAQGAAELRRDLIPTYSGQGVDPGKDSDIDDFPMSSLAKFNTLVLRRSVLASRPPSDWTLVHSGPTYEAWARESGPLATAVVEHLPLGDHSDPGALAQCQAITDLASRAPTATTLAFVPRGSIIRAEPVWDTVPPDWTVYRNGQVVAPSSGTMTLTMDAPTAGEYQPFVRGSFRGRLQISVDGASVFDERHQLMWGTGGTMGEPIPLEQGTHLVKITYDGPDWHPGSGGFTFAFGPILFSEQTAATSYSTLPLDRAQELCGQRLDWVEVIK